MNNLKYYSKCELLEISYDELINNHKGGMVAGVALAYRMLELLFSNINNIDNINYFFTGIGKNGVGVIDTIKYIFKDIEIDIDNSNLLEINAPDTPNGGKYYFEFKDNINKYIFILRDNLVSEEFMTASRESKKYTKDSIPSEVLEKLINARKNQESGVLSLKLEDLFVFMTVSL